MSMTVQWWEPVIPLQFSALVSIQATLKPQNSTKNIITKINLNNDKQVKNK